MAYSSCSSEVIHKVNLSLIVQSANLLLISTPKQEHKLELNHRAHLSDGKTLIKKPLINMLADLRISPGDGIGIPQR